jgi:hypothetical protein
MTAYMKIIDAPNKAYQIAFGEQEEYRNGGPYAGPIYFLEEKKEPQLIHSLCYDQVFFSKEGDVVYFLILVLGNLHCKLASYEIANAQLTIFEKNLGSAYIKNVHSDFVTVGLRSPFTNVAEQDYVLDCRIEKQMSVMQYCKRSHSEIIQRFNKDWTTVDWYYFEVDEDGYATRQIQVLDDGKVHKYSTENLQDEYGGLAEGPLLLEEHLLIEKDEFETLWESPFTNTFLLQHLQFDDQWHMAWHNLNYNTTEAQLMKRELIVCGTYADRFLFELGYIALSEFYFLNVKEGKCSITYTTTTEWDETANVAQLWIERIQTAAKWVHQKLDAELMQFEIRLKIDETIYHASLSTWRNMDWGVEKFRNTELVIGENKYALIDTFEGFEHLMQDVQASLDKENFKIQTCYFCRYSSYNVAGNDNFGDLNCFKHCKEKCLAVQSKHEMIDLLKRENGKYRKVEETFYCNEFEPVQKADFVYK